MFKHSLVFDVRDGRERKITKNLARGYEENICYVESARKREWFHEWMNT